MVIRNYGNGYIKRKAFWIPVSLSLIIICVALILLSGLVLITQFAHALTKPTIVDLKLKLEILYQGNYTPGLRELNHLSSVTQFSFLGNNDILLLSKNDGKVLRIRNYTLVPEPVLDVNVTNQWESGLLGVAALNKGDKTYVFLYYTESTTGDVSNSTAIVLTH